MKFNAMWGAIAVIVALGVHCVGASELVPTIDQQAVVAPQYVHFVTLGAAADSFALRVTLCNEVLIRGESHSWLVVEELVWPIPQPGLDFNAVSNGFSPRELRSEDYLKSAVRVDGAFFHERALEILKPTLHVRGTQKPLVFQGWLSPTRFAVSYWHVRFVLRRTAPGRYDLEEVGKLDEG